MVDLTHLDALLEQTNKNIELVKFKPSGSYQGIGRALILSKLYSTKRSLEDVREMLLDPEIASMPWESPI